jgi:hypothetical protein
VKILYVLFKLYFLKNIFPISFLIGIYYSCLSRFLKFIFSITNSRIESLTEQLITSLRKGNESEGKLAAIVTSLFFIQLGQPDDDLFIKFRDAILPTLRDETKPLSIRKNVGSIQFEIHW